MCLTVVEPAILKAVEGVEQRHVEETDHLTNGIDGKQADNHSLEDKHSYIHEEERNMSIFFLFILA